MKQTIDHEWRRIRAEAGAPTVPALDTASIMNAVRAEAAVQPVRRAPYAVQDVSRWVGAVAASLAFIAAVGMLLQAGGRADREIGVAWTRNVEPTEFVQNVMPGIGHFGGRTP